MSDLPKDRACPHCGRFDNRGVTIDAVIIKNGKIVLAKRGAEPDKGAWGTPGGYVLWDESVEEALRRELYEETKLTVTQAKLVGVYSMPDRHPNQAINLVYLVDVEDRDPIPGDDAVDIKWFKLDALPEKMAFDHRHNIKDALRLLEANRPTSTDV